jgi:hypothetical protein
MVADVGRVFEEACDPKGALILQQKHTPKWPAPELTKHAVCEVLRKCDWQMAVYRPKALIVQQLEWPAGRSATLAVPASRLLTYQ